MKKLLIMAMLAIGTTAFAEDYKYLTMGYNSVEKSIDLSTIQKITCENGNVVVTTSNGNETFQLSEMEKMYFSSEATAIKGVQAEASQAEKTVYDLAGRRISASSVYSASPVLPKGVYIINGKKVVVK